MANIISVERRLQFFLDNIWKQSEIIGDQFCLIEGYTKESAMSAMQTSGKVCLEEIPPWPFVTDLIGLFINQWKAHKL